MFTISLLVRKERTADLPGCVVNEYEFEHIPEADLTSAEGRAIVDEALAVLRRLK